MTTLALLIRESSFFQRENRENLKCCILFCWGGSLSNPLTRSHAALLVYLLKIVTWSIFTIEQSAIIILVRDLIKFSIMKSGCRISELSQCSICFPISQTVCYTICFPSAPSHQVSSWFDEHGRDWNRRELSFELQSFHNSSLVCIRRKH
jgi:hypothetical protein